MAVTANQHLIIGAGPAGVIAAEHLHKLNPDAAITIVGDEPEPPYSRMALPYYLSNKVGEEGTYLRKGPDYFINKNIELRNDRVAGVAPDKKQVGLRAARF